MVYDIRCQPLAAVPLAAQASPILLSPLPDSSAAEGGEFLLRFHHAARAFLRLMADELGLQMGSYTIATQGDLRGFRVLPNLDLSWRISVLRTDTSCLCIGVEPVGDFVLPLRVIVWSGGV